jgi:hypothetical protein
MGSELPTKNMSKTHRPGARSRVAVRRSVLTSVILPPSTEGVEREPPMRRFAMPGAAGQRRTWLFPYILMGLALVGVAARHLRPV